jgi:hypothetical protein
VGHGDFLQIAHSDRIESRLVLRFKDGSLVRCDGALSLKGPVWRIEMTTAR